MIHYTHGTRRAAILALLAAMAALGSCQSASTASSDDAHELYGEGPYDINSARRPTIETLHSVAHVMAAQGRDAEAALVLQRLIDTHPRFLPAYNELAELYLRQDDPEAARAALEAGLEVDPVDPVLLNNLGMWYFLRQDYDEALAWFTQAAAANPRDARSRANMAAALGMLGRIDESLSLYYMIMRPSQAHHNAGVLCEAIGQLARAEDEFRMASKKR